MNFERDIYSKTPIPVQTVLLNLKAMELYFERFGKKFQKRFEEFDRNQWLSEPELVAYQNERLRRLIAHAYEHVPYYRRIMDARQLKPEDIKKREDLPKLPILKREDVKKHARDLVSRAYPKWLLRHGHTSGTTGSPLDFYYDIQICVVHLAAAWRQKYWAGMTRGEPYASLQGRVIVPLNQLRPPFWRKNYLNNQLFLSSFHLKEENLPDYFQELKRAGIQFIEGYPSTLYILALYLNKHGQSFPLKAVLSSSETLFDYQREAIEKAFQCKMFDFYGMAERAVFATECDHHNGHHLNLDYGITEFIDSSDQPVAAGSLGRIVATSLHNYAMPFLRYQTNDACALKKESACTCGRGFPLMEDVATKNESIVSLPDGRLISPSVLTHPFKPMHNIVASQIVQEHIDELKIRIVKGEHYRNLDENMLLKAFSDRLGNQIKISIQYVEEIPKEASGKFKWVISKIPPTF
jgi:phenylacetate-CoA ligase